jgi:nucleotide-binding universal stress UspA family protein
VLIPLDGSDLAERAVPSAEQLAEALDADFTLLRVVERPAVLYSDVALQHDWPQRADSAAAAAYLANVAAGLRSRTARPVAVRVQAGAVAATIRATADQLQASALVIATHARSGPSRVLFGSTATTVLEHTSVPLLLVAGGAPAAPRGDRLGEVRKEADVLPNARSTGW